MRSVALVHKYLSGMYDSDLSGKPDLDRSLEHARIAAELDERRMTIAPGDAQTRLDLAFSLSMLATGWDRRNDLSKATGYAEQSVQIRRMMYEADPKDHRARDRLAYGLYLTGRLYHRQRNWPSALACLREAVEHSDALARSTDFWGSWDTLSAARVELAEVYETLGSGDACAEYRRAAEAYRRLIQLEAQGNRDPRAALSSVEAKLASCGVR